MLHALLLSPDDQAVSAISGVLEEMSVTCERPLDGASAAQKLNSQSFDLVLVDCENLPAAKLIFDVCRRGKSGNNPVPIAIVDGRAGLPTAFRLGAELILTKPVAKDQARTTIRTAIGRVRKDVTMNESASDPNGSETVPELRAMAAAAGASPQLTSFAELNPVFARGTVPPSYLTAALTASGLAAPSMHSPVEEIAHEAETKSAAPKLNGQSASSPSFSESSSSDADLVALKTPRSSNPADDLVLAELDREEFLRSEAAESEVKNSAADKSENKKPSAKSSAKASSSYSKGRGKSRAPLVALLMLMLAVAVFCAAWKYQPGFRDIAQPRLSNLLHLADLALPSTQTPAPQKPSAQVVPAKAASTALPAAKNAAPGQTASTNPATTAVTTPAPAAVTTVASTVSAPLPSASTVATTNPTVASNSEANKVSAAQTVENKKSMANTAPIAIAAKAAPLPPASSATALSDAPLPGEKDAIILSSKGAEKRLAHSVPPKYPAGAGSPAAEGKIVLKTVVNKNGQVEGVRLVDGNAILATSAMQAVRQWRYHPYVRDGKALPFQTVVILDSQHP
jgi:TonB family protein